LSKLFLNKFTSSPGRHLLQILLGITYFRVGLKRKKAQASIITETGLKIVVTAAYGFF